MATSSYKSLLFVLLLSSFPSKAQEIGKSLSPWQEGQMDIHHISTGRGNATFFILPDGTTMLVDAGALDPTEARTMSERNTAAKPSGERQPGEWISRYIRNRSKEIIDYAVITHFHDDHMGTTSKISKKSAGDNYLLAGITEVGEHVRIAKIIDRGWPDYNYARPHADTMMSNYRRFLTYQIRNKGMIVEQSVAGRNDQIVLVNKPDAFKDLFEIRNISVNGAIWTGVGTITRQHFPDLKSLQPASYPSENMCSIGMRITYGKFDYFTGGDMPGVLQPGVPTWNDVETPVAKAVGPVDAQILNHHGNRDSQNDFFLAALHPRVLIIPTWSSDHPGHDVLDRIYSQRIYAGERDVFATGMLQANKLVIGDLLDRLKSDHGHIVIRVEKGGDLYQVYTLDDNDEVARVLAVNGPYLSR
jgi:beta-lactamase superfamily II metal-dependent hydrolase